MSRFDRPASEHRRSCAIERANACADDAWREAVMTAIERVARRLPELTTDDVMAAHPELEDVREPRSWGPLMLRAAREDWIEPTDRYAPSSRKQSNARPKRVWRSRIHPGARPRPKPELDIVQGVLL